MPTPPKLKVQKIFHTLNTIALSAWFGAVAMSGVVAATVFPTMGRLKPTLGAYPNYEGNHALLGAGQIAGKVFTIVDSIQFGAASIALGSLITMIVAGYQIATIPRLLRLITLLLTMGVLSYHIFLLMPGMMDDLANYWNYADQGNTEQADIYKQKFMNFHETAANSLKALTLGTLICLIFSAWTGVESTPSRTPDQAS